MASVLDEEKSNILEVRREPIVCDPLPLYPISQFSTCHLYLVCVVEGGGGIFIGKYSLENIFKFNEECQIAR